jgi:hypothetical protein
MILMGIYIMQSDDIKSIPLLSATSKLPQEESQENCRFFMDFQNNSNSCFRFHPFYRLRRPLGRIEV